MEIKNIELNKIVPVDEDSFGIVLTFESDGKEKYFARKLPKDHMNKSINELFNDAVEEIEDIYGGSFSYENDIKPIPVGR